MHMLIYRKMVASNNFSNITLFLVVIVLSCFASGGRSGFVNSTYLQVPQSKFEVTVGSTISVVRQVMTTVSEYPRELDDFRLSNAVTDCLDLMDFSVDLLSSALAVSRSNQNDEHNSTGTVSADMKCWLSGALFNQDTCKEGFDGTKTDNVGSLISDGLDQVTSLVENLLSMVKPSLNPSSPDVKQGFPDWLKPHDRKHLLSVTRTMADAIVAMDGTGNFTSIQKAIDAAPEYIRTRFVIHIKRGVYKEYVEINKKKWNVMLIGDGVDATVVSGNRNYVDGWTTYRTATFSVRGQGFIARDITFENTAGPEKHQAVAFRSDSDQAVLYRCAFRGFQDTLYPHSMRQFYRECKITGTVDFIFGDGTVVFQNCEIFARKGLANQKNTITAQGRKHLSEPSGFSIQFCNITADSSSPTYLGRPWKPYSRTVVMQSYISSAIRPEGWLEWNGNFALDSLYYGEYMNYGPGAGLWGRVKWPGYHVINDSAQANRFTVAQFIVGNDWLPSTGVKYIAGLGM